MIQSKVLTCGLSLIVLGAAPAFGEPRSDTPKTLEMRARPVPGKPWLRARLPRQVAQSPTPDVAPGDGNPPADPVDNPPRPAIPEPAPDPAPVSRSPATPSAPAGELTDAEFEKLAEH